MNRFFILTVLPIIIFAGSSNQLTMPSIDIDVLFGGFLVWWSSNTSFRRVRCSVMYS